MKGYRLRGNERGSVLLFMLGTFLFLLVFGGFAIDLAFFSTARGELQRSMDAAALAGAGQLGLNDSVFGAVRDEAQKFALLNPTRANLSELNPTGAINLDQNIGNADLDGDITLGVWDGATFTPKLDGSEVNAVRCQYATDVPTSFLGILGLDILRVSAQAIAVAGPPAELEPGACLAPIGLSSCPFFDNSAGCGTLVSFISSSDDSLTGTNTAAWINLNGNGTPNSNYLSNTWDEMKNNNCPASTPSLDATVGTNNGMIQSVMVDVEEAFVVHYNATLNEPDWILVTNNSDDEVYNHPGWEMSAAVLDSGEDCPPGAITGPHTIIGWTRFVMAQVVNGGECAVANHFDGNPWDELCPPPNGTGTAETIPQNSGSFRAVYGYYSCDLIDSPPIPTPAPRASIATGRKLVQ